MSTIAYQRHACLEAVRRLLKARVAVQSAWEAHEKAKEALAATGAVLAPEPGRWSDGQVALRQQAVRMLLPTQQPLDNARHAEGKAWDDLCDTLQRSPAVQAELFAMLGAGQ